MFPNPETSIGTHTHEISLSYGAQKNKNTKKDKETTRKEPIL